jgi:tetratricopeptide (TPR) repeat protein
MGFTAEMRSGDLEFQIEHKDWEEVKDAHLDAQWEEYEGDTLEDMYPDASPEEIQQIRAEDTPPETTREDYWPSLAVAAEKLGEADVVRLYVKVDPESLKKRLDEFEGDEDRRKALEKAYKTQKEIVEDDPDSAWYLVGEIFHSKEKEEVKTSVDGVEISIGVPVEAYYNINESQFPRSQQLEFNELEEIQEALRFFQNLINANKALPIDKPDRGYVEVSEEELHGLIMEHFDFDSVEEAEEFINDLMEESRERIEEEDEDEQ